MNVLGVLDYVRFMLRRERKNLSPVEKEFQIWVENIWELFIGRLHDTPREDRYSFAPIRSKPQRTYDPLKETASPEGSDIPMVLMNMFRANEKAWKELKERFDRIWEIFRVVYGYSCQAARKVHGRPLSTANQSQRTEGQYDRCRLWRKSASSHFGTRILNVASEDDVFDATTGGSSTSKGTSRTVFSTSRSG